MSDKRQARSAARLYAVQALFQMEQSGTPTDTVKREFLEHRFGAEQEDGAALIDGDIAHFTSVIEGAVNWQARVDQMTDRALVAKWPIDRIDTTLRALFRAGGAELVSMDTPPRVVITEYLGVAEAFYPDGREPRFVNAVLDHMAREARPEAF